MGWHSMKNEKGREEDSLKVKHIDSRMFQNSGGGLQ